MKKVLFTVALLCRPPADEQHEFCAGGDNRHYPVRPHVSLGLGHCRSAQHRLGGSRD